MSSTSSLPSNKTYLDLIYEALLTLHIGSPTSAGCSLQAIKKHIHHQYPDLDLKGHYLRASLKKGINDKKIIQLKGSYRLSVPELRHVTKRPTIMRSVENAKKSTPKKSSKTRKSPSKKSK